MLIVIDKMPPKRSVSSVNEGEDATDVKQQKVSPRKRASLSSVLKEGEAYLKQLGFSDSNDETPGRRRTRASAKGVVYTPPPSAPKKERQPRSTAGKGKRGRPSKKEIVEDSSSEVSEEKIETDELSEEETASPNKRKQMKSKSDLLEEDEKGVASGNKKKAKIIKDVVEEETNSDVEQEDNEAVKVLAQPIDEKISKKGLVEPINEEVNEEEKDDDIKCDSLNKTNETAKSKSEPLSVDEKVSEKNTVETDKSEEKNSKTRSNTSLEKVSPSKSPVKPKSVSSNHSPVKPCISNNHTPVKSSLQSSPKQSSPLLINSSSTKSESTEVPVLPPKPTPVTPAPALPPKPNASPVKSSLPSEATLNSISSAKTNNGSTSPLSAEETSVNSATKNTTNEATAILKKGTPSSNDISDARTNSVSVE